MTLWSLRGLVSLIDGFVEVPTIAAPAAPAAGKVRVYAKSDKKVYIKDDAGLETALTGDVAGPAGATDKAVALFDGITGKLLKNSSLLIEPISGSALHVHGPDNASPVTPTSVVIRSGNATGGTVNSGDTIIDTGTSSGGTTGTVSLGTTTANAVSVGRTGKNTQVNGSLGVTQAAAFSSTLDIGHASDTTLSRKSAGVLQVETNELYAQNGTDVAVADGGTGASTAAAALTNLGAEAVTSIARGAGAASNINSTSVVNLASCTNTIAAGDTFCFQMNGYILNNSGGARTYTVRVTIGATTFDLVFDATLAASATNLSYVQVYAEVCVISSSSIGCTIQVRRGAPAAAGTAQSNVLAQDRNIVRTSTNNEIGSKTVAIGVLSNSNTATQTFTLTRGEICKGAAI